MNPSDPELHHPDLLGLLRGELSNAGASAAGEHLRGCETCRDDLVDAAVGHGLLTRAVAALGADPVAPALPAPPVRGPRPHPRRRRTARVLAVAAALVLVGGTGAALVRATDEDPAPQPPGVASASALLSPVDPALDPSGDGRVQMVASGAHHTQMTVRVTGLPAPGTDHYYYAWLLDPASQKMLPLGQVAADGSTTFDLDEVLVSAYSAIDVSLESDDGDPGHSVTSVLRGGYDPAAIPS